MRKDEQRSRLAIADLEARPPPANHIPPASTSSTSSSRSQSSSEDYLHRVQSHSQVPYNWSSSSLRAANSAYPRRDSASRPSALNFDSYRRSSISRGGSSDSLSSSGQGQYSPKAYSPQSLVQTQAPIRRSNLRAMTPIHSTFEEEGLASDAVNGKNADFFTQAGKMKAMQNPTSPMASSPLRGGAVTPERAISRLSVSQNIADTKDDTLVSSTYRPSPPSRTRTILSRDPRQHQQHSMTQRRLSKSLARSIVANPVLSLGDEGHALGTITLPSSAPDSWQYSDNKLQRGFSSTASIPKLSCSPSSPASSVVSSSSNRSSASTAPSEVYHSGHTKQDSVHGHRRSTSSVHLPVPVKSNFPVTTLHDYALYSQTTRPLRTPSFPALTSAYGRSPPSHLQHSAYSPSKSDGGPISQIVHAKVQQYYTKNSNGSASLNRRRDSRLGPVVPFPALDADESSSKDNTPVGNPIYCRSGSSASVTSLPHYFADKPKESYNGRRSGEMERRVSNDGHNTRRPGHDRDRSAPANGPTTDWNWDSLPAYNPKQKPASSASDSRKRLFYFSSDNPQFDDV